MTDRGEEQRERRRKIGRRKSGMEKEEVEEDGKKFIHQVNQIHDS